MFAPFCSFSSDHLAGLTFAAMTDPEEDLLTFAAMTARNLDETCRTQTPAALSARICDNTRQLRQTQHWLPTFGMRYAGICRSDCRHL